MDLQTIIIVNYIIIGIYLIIIILILRNVYLRGKRVNKRRPEVRERYKKMILKR